MPAESFKLCPGLYQVELLRCLHENLLDVVILGYQPPPESRSEGELSLVSFVATLHYPVVLVGHDGPASLLLNEATFLLRDQLPLDDMMWQLLSNETAMA